MNIKDKYKNQPISKIIDDLKSGELTKDQYVYNLLWRDDKMSKEEVDFFLPLWKELQHTTPLIGQYYDYNQLYLEDKINEIQLIRSFHKDTGKISPEITEKIIKTANKKTLIYLLHALDYVNDKKTVELCVSLLENINPVHFDNLNSEDTGFLNSFFGFYNLVDSIDKIEKDASMILRVYNFTRQYKINFLHKAAKVASIVLKQELPEVIQEKENFLTCNGNDLPEYLSAQALLKYDEDFVAKLKETEFSQRDILRYIKEYGASLLILHSKLPQEIVVDDDCIIPLIDHGIIENIEDMGLTVKLNLTQVSDSVLFDSNCYFLDEIVGRKMLDQVVLSDKQKIKAISFIEEIYGLEDWAKDISKSLLPKPQVNHSRKMI